MYLNCHTHYSLRYGTLSPEALVEAAQKRGVTALALTDINNTSCMYECYTRCREAGIRLIAGLEFRKDNRLLYVGIAKNKKGFAELNEFLSRYSMDEKPLPALAPAFQEAYIIYPSLVKPITDFSDNELLGIRPQHVHRLFTSPVRRLPHKLVIFSPVTFLNETGHRLHQLLRAIDENTLISKLNPKTTAGPNELFYTPEDLLRRYEPYPNIINNTRRIMRACSIDFENGLQVNRQCFTGSKEGDFNLLEKLALEGCRHRYGKADETQLRRALERTAKELKVIRQQNFESYFLITWDIIRYAQSAGYHHVGRGSGANSIVAFCLGISDVDPLELDLYFERFINPYRTSPPDFDIDFSWDERDDVTDYIFRRYGRDHTALLATYSTFQLNAAIRELGKVFGLPKADIDYIADHWRELIELKDGEWKWTNEKERGDIRWEIS